jgi:hypothetical protein
VSSPDEWIDEWIGVWLGSDWPDMRGCRELPPKIEEGCETGTKEHGN